MLLHVDARAEPQRVGGPLSGGITRDDEIGLVGVADSPRGGGLAQAASQLGLDVIRGHMALHKDVVLRYRRSPTEALRARIIEAFEDAFGRAAKEIYALGRRRSASIEVAVDMVVVAGREAFVGHVGDGAVYLLRRGLLHRLTTEPPIDEEDDDSVIVLPLPTRGGGPAAMGAPKGRRPPPRPIGAEPSANAEIITIELKDGDRLLAANGVLTSTLPEERLRADIGERTLDRLIEHLLDNARGQPGWRSLLLGGVHVGEQRPPARLSPEAEARARLEVLSRMPMFAGCKPAELESVAGVTRPLTFRRNAALLTQGQAGDGIYLLVQGEVAILKDGRELVRVGPGANFGEMSLLDEPLASATVKATIESEVLFVSKDAFFRLLKANPTFAVKVLWNMLLGLSANLRKTSALLAEATGGHSDID